jgi:FkbM family methyltransferase
VIREFIVSKEDYAPGLFNWLRYQWHVEWQRSMVYPNLLGPILEKQIGRDGVAIDVGANKGLFTRYLAKFFERVHAVEPIEHLARRLEAMAMRGVSVHHCALGDIDGDVMIRTPIDEAGRPVDALTTASQENAFELFGHHRFAERKVPVHRLSSILKQSERVAFIKVDVEGFENAVIDGAADVLEHHRPILMIEISRAHNACYQDMLNMLQGLAYCGYTMTPNSLRAHMDQDIADQPMSIAVASDKKPFWDFIFIPEEKKSEFSKYLN